MSNPRASFAVKTLIKDPLLHFLLLGIAIYLIVDAANPAARNELAQQILVQEADIIKLMQQKEQNYKPEIYQARFAQLSDEQLANLVDEFAEQEVLYREAQSLGLDQNDEVQRRRMVQKMKYFLEGFADANTNIDAAAISKFYQDNSQRYVVDAQVSFSHVFYKTNPSNESSAKLRAKQALADAGSRPPATRDHFPYHKNYLAKTQSQIERHFGAEFAKAVFELKVDQDNWQGPIESAYGVHLVRLLKHKASELPPLSVIRDRVQEDALRALQYEARKQQIGKLKSNYSIKFDADN